MSPQSDFAQSRKPTTHSNGSPATNGHGKLELTPQMQRFQSEDSEGSNMSCDSSIESAEYDDKGKAQYFKEEMARFFINYPELRDDGIIGEADDDDDHIKNLKGAGSNSVWSELAQDILTSAKEESNSLESLAKRISSYRYKIEQPDLIDYLLAEEQNIIREIDHQIGVRKQENAGTLNAGLTGTNSTGGYGPHKEQELQNTDPNGHQFYSWRKRQQIERKNRLTSTNPINLVLTAPANANTSVRKATSLSNYSAATQSQSVQRFTMSLNKARNQNPSKTRELILKKRSQQETAIEGVNGNYTPSQMYGNNTSNNNNIASQASSTALPTGQGSIQMSPMFKHLVNFEPQTELGRFLCDQIRKNSNPNDQLSIKRAIMSFLVKNRQTIQCDIINKPTLSQKMQKLYNEQSKELLLFYPAGKANKAAANSAQATLQSQQQAQVQQQQAHHGHSDGTSPFGAEKLIAIMKAVSEGPLLKYWKKLQEDKVMGGGKTQDG